MTGNDLLVELLRGTRERPVDRATVGRLERAVEGFERTKPAVIGSVGWTIDGRPSPGLLESVGDPSTRFDPVELTVGRPPAPGQSWGFVRPIARAVIEWDGSASVYPPDGVAERAIARVLPREGFGTLRSAAGLGPGRLLTLGGFAQGLRMGGYVPFCLALELYASHERFRYDLDLITGSLLGDARSAHFAPSARVRRTARQSWSFDQTVSLSDLPPRIARVLEAIWESGAVSEPDLQRIFGPVDGGSEAIQALGQRRLIEPDPLSGGWRVRADSLEPPRRARPPLEEVPAEPGSLKQSVHELLAGAEAQATCPMCGDEFPPGYPGILCERCEREVHGGPRAA